MNVVSNEGSIRCYTVLVDNIHEGGVQNGSIKRKKLIDEGSVLKEYGKYLNTGQKRA